MSHVTNQLKQTAVKQSFDGPETFLGINRYLTNGRRENCQCTGVKEEVMGNKGPEGVQEIKGKWVWEIWERRGTGNKGTGPQHLNISQAPQWKGSQPLVPNAQYRSIIPSHPAHPHH